MEYPNLIKAINVIKSLRHPVTGCPWDLEQTNHSLLKYLIEESYEYMYAVETQDTKKMEEELGDVLLQVLLHAQIGEDEGKFNLDSAAKVLAEKMIDRHPHVFKQKEELTPGEVLNAWENNKQKNKTSRYSINMDDTHMPALMAAARIGKKSKNINFDWTHVSEVMDKVKEELQEVQEELDANVQSKEKIAEEIGDLLFSVAQLARHLDLDPEMELRRANQKFIKRINQVEEIVLNSGKKMSELPTSELEKIWQKIKTK